MCCEASIPQIPFDVWPLLQATIVEPLQFIGDDERDMPIRHTFLEHNEPSHTSVPVLERMNPFETMMKIKDIINADEELKHTYELITTIPGIGAQNAVCLLTFTNNFTRFGYNARKIACYYGIAPFGRDSGTSVHSDPHVHYMANRMLKAMLTQAALASIRCCAPISHYYHRLLSLGKKKQIALNNVKNKLIHIITAMVRNNQPFEPEYININKLVA